MRIASFFCLVLLGVLLVGLVSFFPPVRAKVGSQSATQPATGYWFPYGPAPLRYCGGGTPPEECSGRISAIAIDPTDPSVIYVGSATGGVWKSSDGGSTWTPLTDNLTEGTLAIGALAISGNGAIYAGTGDGNWAFYGSGILKSTDGGETWSLIGEHAFGRSAITSLAVDPTSPDKIFATATFGETRSSYSDGVYVDPGVSLGVFVSTDGGSSWKLTYTTKSNQFDDQAWDVVIDPDTPSTVYAAADGGVLVSHDGGITWADSSSGLPASTSVGRIDLGISQSSPTTLYSALQYYDGSTNGAGRLYESTNGGVTWSMLTTPPPSESGAKSFCGEQCDYNLYVAVDPTDPKTIYLGGLDAYRSTDGGTSWNDLGGYTNPNYIHSDQHALVFSPASHTTIYIGNDGGIWASQDANSCSPSSCWTDLNAGLGITQFYSIAVDPKNSLHLIGGVQDNGCLSHNGFSATWTEDTNCGDGGWTAFDPSNPQIMYEAQDWSNYALGYDAVYRSEDGGATWTPIESGLSVNDTANFMVPLALDLSDPNILYLGTTNLYKTTDRGTQWSKPNPGLSLPPTDHCYNGECISAIAVAPSADNVVYVGTTIGNIYTSVDQGQHFSRSSGANAPVTQIAVDPTTPTRVYATFSGFGNGHVYASRDGGSSWNDISSNLPDYPADSIAISSDGSSIYVGTDRGVYVTVNDGVSWEALGRGLPRVPVMDLKLARDGRLWAATYGRGAWVYSPKILVIFSRVPVGATVVVDGVTYSGAQLSGLTFNWDPGSIHTLQVQQFEAGLPGTRYEFVSWSNGSTELTETVTATTPGDYSPDFKTQFLLTVMAAYDTAKGAGWYDQGATATYSVRPRTLLPGILGLLGAKATFIGWSNGVKTSASTVIMYGPVTVQAQWRTDYTLAYVSASVISIVAVAIVFLIAKKRKWSSTARRTCSRCGHVLPNDSTFCVECGAPVEK